jgi:membrane protein implicated in regulation of membrane protease activity
MELFENMEPLLKTFWFIAIPASLVFLVQTVMTFTGADASDGIDADFDSNLSGTDAPFQLFSLRNLVNFMLGTGWAGISLYDTIGSRPLLIFVSFLVGCAFIALFFVSIRQIRRLGEDNSFKITNALSKTGEVYLSIPAAKNGKGKVQVSVNGAFHELEAITEREKIETGTLVRIVKIESNSLVLVEKI